VMSANKSLIPQSRWRQLLVADAFES